jgi:hypothetical protein
VTDEPKLPSKPPEAAKLRAADLELLSEDARRLTVRDRPAADVLWTRLLQPKGRVLREYRELLRTWSLSDADATPGAFAALLDGTAAIDAVAVATVAKAMLGDPVMIAQVFDRIEGKPTPRKLDDQEQGQARVQMVAAVEAAVRRMNARPGDNAQLIEQPPAEPKR